MHISKVRISLKCEDMLDGPHYFKDCLRIKMKVVL